MHRVPRKVKKYHVNSYVRFMHVRLGKIWRRPLPSTGTRKKDVGTKTGLRVLAAIKRVDVFCIENSILIDIKYVSDYVEAEREGN